MKIIDKTTYTGISLESLAVGDVFRVGKKLWLKTARRYTSCSDIRFDCLDLTTFEVIQITGGLEVIPYMSELTIVRKKSYE